jgi:2-dehydro-3-deoxygluconokinase
MSGGTHPALVCPQLMCMGEPMLELNAQPLDPAGRRLYLEGFGGDTSNAAIAAARQGVSVAYATAIGRDDAGERFLALWRAEGVDVEAVKIDTARPTALYLVTHGAGGHQFHFYRTGSAASAYAPADVPEAMLTKSRMFYASGISQGISDSAADAVLHAIAVARHNRVRVAFGTNYRPRLWPRARAAALIHAAAAKADILLASIEDAAALAGATDADAAADFYQRLGPSIVVVTLGAEGALLADGTKRVRIPALHGEVVDATGAGDAFAGAFLARLLAGDEAEAAARYASVAAGLKVRGYGAVAPIPRAAEVRAELARC